jgi:prepilin-type processing-associated H-X9-DG protein
MAGEKHVPQGQFTKGWHDNCYYNGNYTLSTMRAAGPNFPLAQSPTEDNKNAWVFGSYHTGICPFVFCDGHVRSLPNSIPTPILGLLACRDDGQPIPEY